MRIASLLPSATEILFALGLGDQVVAVSHVCDFPAAARSLPSVVESKIDSDRLTSLEIDRRVNEAVTRGDSLYRVDEERLAALAPDLIVTQGLCDVCALDEHDVRAAARKLPHQPQVLSLSASRFDDVLDDIRRVAGAAAVTNRGESLSASLRGRIEQVRGPIGAQLIGAQAGRQVTGSRQQEQLGARPRVACLEWLDPPFAAGHWLPEMVQWAGGVDVLARPGEPSRRLTWDEILNAKPDIVLVMPCGYDLNRGRTEIDQLQDRPEWRRLTAGADSVWVTDASRLFSRPGPGLVDGLETLAGILQPHRFGSPAPNHALEIH